MWQGNEKVVIVVRYLRQEITLSGKNLQKYTANFKIAKVKKIVKVAGNHQSCYFLRKIIKLLLIMTIRI